jgi:hypothetical protein
MLEEISLDDVEPEPLLWPISSGRLPGPTIITNGDWVQNQTIGTSIVDRGKNALSQQQSYMKLAEEESEQVDTVRQQVSL